MALDATPGGAASNSYATLVRFNAYLADHLDGAAVASKTDDQKERALKTATRQMDSFLAWSGSALSIVQALALPRYGLVDPQTNALVDASTIPARVELACCEQARLLLAVGDRTNETDAEKEGLASIKAGSVELSFSKRIEVRAAIAPSALAFVAAWAVPTDAGRGGTIALARR